MNLLFVESRLPYHIRNRVLDPKGFVLYEETYRTKLKHKQIKPKSKNTKLTRLTYEVGEFC